MFSGDLLLRLKKLNPRLTVYSKDNSGKHAGLHYIDEREGPVLICAINKNWIPEFSKADREGHLIEAGWRRAVKLLLTFKRLNGQSIVTREAVKKNFGSGFFDYNREPNPLDVVEYGNPVTNLINKRQAEALDKKGAPILTPEDVLEAKSLMDKRVNTDAEKEQAERDKWLIKKDPDAYVKSVSKDEYARATENWTGCETHEEFNKHFK